MNLLGLQRSVTQESLGKVRRGLSRGWAVGVKRQLIRSGIFVVLSLSWACTWTPSATVLIRADQPTIPVSVGVMISREFEEWIHIDLQHMDGRRYYDTIRIGQSSARLFREGLPRLFEQVYTVTNEAADNRFRLLLIPKIVTSTASIVQGDQVVEVVYGVKIVDRDGGRSWVESGIGTGMNVVYHPVRLMVFPLILTGQVVTLGAWNINTQGYTSAFADAQAEAFDKLAAQLRNSPAVAKALKTTRLEETLAGLPPEESSLEAQITRLSAQLLGSLGAAPPRRIAMAGFTPVSGPSTQLEAFLAEELTTRLVMAKPHTVVERSLLEKALQELRLNQSDLVDPKQAKALGKLTGADAVLVGSTADLGDQVRVAVRLVETETGTVLSAGSVSLFLHGAAKTLRSHPIKRPSP